MPICRAVTYRRSRWKNGGGETAEIAIAPADAAIDNFDWRISMATVASDGAFSIFEGVDRTLCILDGAGTSLVVAGTTQMLDRESDPFEFSGDAPASATLVDGPVTDFNVMTRRHRCTHAVRRVQLDRDEALTCDDRVTVVFCHTGILEVTGSAAIGRVESLDSLIRDAADTSHWQLRALAPAAVYLVSISAASPDRGHDRTAASHIPR